MKHLNSAGWKMGAASGSSPLAAQPIEYRPIAPLALLPARRRELLLLLGAAAWLVPLCVVARII